MRIVSIFRRYTHRRIYWNDNHSFRLEKWTKKNNKTHPNETFVFFFRFNIGLPFHATE